MYNCEVITNDNKHDNDDKQEKVNSDSFDYEYVSHSELNDTQSYDNESILSSTSSKAIRHQSMAPLLAKLCVVEKSLKEMQFNRKRNNQLSDMCNAEINRKIANNDKEIKTIYSIINKNENNFRVPFIEISFIILTAFLVPFIIYAIHGNDSQLQLNATDVQNNESYFKQYENKLQKYEHEIQILKTELENTKQWQNIIETKLKITENNVNGVIEQINIIPESNAYNQNTTASTQLSHKDTPIMIVAVIAFLTMIAIMALMAPINVKLNSNRTSVEITNRKLENTERLLQINKDEIDNMKQELSARFESISDYPNNEVMQQLAQQWSILDQKNTELNNKNSNFEHTLTLHNSKLNGLESSFQNMQSELAKDKSALERIESQVVQCGTVAYFANNDAPIGWIKANGESVSRITYANLFAKIGSTFGSGDGSTTFTLPDLRGEFIRGWSDGRYVDKDRTFASFQWGSSIPMAGYIDGRHGRAHSSAHHDRWGFAGHSFDEGFENNVASGEWRYGVQYTSTNDETYVGYCDARNNGHITSWNILKGTRPRNFALLACIKY